MRAVSLRAVYAAIVLLGVSACASQEQRYQENKERARLSPHAKARLSPADVDQIARLIASATQKRIIGISPAPSRQHPNAYDVTIGIPGGYRPEQFGIYIVEPQRGQWHIVRRMDSLSVPLVGLAAYDPPD